MAWQKCADICLLCVLLGVLLLSNHLFTDLGSVLSCCTSGCIIVDFGGSEGACLGVYAALMRRFGGSKSSAGG